MPNASQTSEDGQDSSPGKLRHSPDEMGSPGSSSNFHRWASSGSSAATSSSALSVSWTRSAGDHGAPETDSPDTSSAAGKGAATWAWTDTARSAETDVISRDSDIVHLCLVLGGV
ncbi:hypothetical protein IMZ48_34985 [Candidatus Bathyarchaeota archaeon]|nr:hypothetical protein [Candidatus Bathyarchaeota archaeon]